MATPLKTKVLEGHTGFDPALNGYDFVNTAEAYGTVELNRGLFDRTFSLVLDRKRFYYKMYRDILGATQDENGTIVANAPLSTGLCTGMVRSALQFFLEEVSPPAAQRTPAGETLEQIKLLHGRQLTDRALLNAARWLVWGGPRRVFFTFRDAVISGYRDPLAFDIGVPTLRRKDFLRAVQAEGHTVIPYAFRQNGSQAEISIYDPNYPGMEGLIQFDLAKNSYYYTDRYQSVRANGETTTIVAVPQSAYQKGRTALLASLANFFI